MPGLIDRTRPDAAGVEAGAQLPPSIVFPGAGAAPCGAPDGRDTLDFVEDALRRIVGFEHGGAALRELEAFLIEALSLVERDPALELAAKDLLSAARIIADVGECPTADRRRLRLLADAERRFRARLAHGGDRRHG
jgi:hypothetical protein